MTLVITNRTYRYAAVGAMALVAVLPSVYLAGQALYFQGPDLVADQVEMCTRYLGMPVEIGQVAVQSPRAMTYHDFRIIDPETNLHLAQCDRLEIEAGEMRLMLTGFGVSFHAPGADGALDRLQRMMQQSQRITWDTIEVRCPEPGAFHAGGETVAFVSLDADCHLNANPQTTTLRIMLPDRARGLPLVAQVTVRPSRTGRQTALAFATGPAPVSYEVAKVFLEIQTWLGTACRTQGTGKLVRQAGTQAVTFSGALRGIDLATLAHGRLPVGLTGQVDLQVDELRWSDGQLESFKGQLTGGPGGVHASLARLLPRPPFGFLWLEPIPDAPAVAFEQVGADLSIDRHQVSVRGTLPASGDPVGPHNGVVLSGRTGPLLLDPLKPIPLDALRFWFSRELPESLKRQPTTEATPWWEAMLPMGVAEDFLGLGLPGPRPGLLPLELADYVMELMLPDWLRYLPIP